VLVLPTNYQNSIDPKELIIAGDFNTTLHHKEKKGGSIVRDPSREHLEDLISTYQLLDIKPSNGRYTWSNRRLGPGHITARLDHFLLSSSFLEEAYLPSSRILPWTGSDHRPITLTLSPPRNPGPIPYRFNPLWIPEPGFLDIVSDAWNCWIQGSPNYIWEQKLKRVKMALKSWVTRNKGKDQEAKESLMREMEENRRSLEERQITHELLLKEQQNFMDYQKILHKEEETWRLKSRSLWLTSGDRNTKFFQRQAKARIWRNEVKEITKADGTKIDDPHQIQEEAKLHFQALLTEDGNIDINVQESLLQNIPSKISQEDNYMINQEVTEKELHEALFQLHPDKAPGPDGFTAHFYQKCWHIIKRDLLRMVQYVQKSAKIGGNTNSTFLALIPKDLNPSSFNRFRPISLCNVSYKIIAKIIANRIKPLLHKLISPNQSGFMEKRQMIDNIILVQEAIHSSRERGDQGMIVKIDMANAFDRVRHSFLIAVLKKFGFNTGACGLDISLYNRTMDSTSGQWTTDKFLQKYQRIEARLPTLPNSVYNHGRNVEQATGEGKNW
jgi:hypothetical protein